MAYTDEVLADAPLVYWPLDDDLVAGTTTVVDASGNGRSGTVTGTPNDGVLPCILTGTAMSIVSGEMFTRATEAALSTAQWTVELWTRHNTPSFGRLAARSTSTGTHWLISRNNNGTVTASNYGSTVASATSTTNITDGLNHHVVAVQDATHVRLYIDGTEEASVPSVPSTPTNRALYLGNDATGSNGINAIVDEFAVYGAPLTPERVAVHYAIGTGAEPPQPFRDPRDIPGLLFWYSAQAETGAASGTTLAHWNDQSGNENHATAVGSPKLIIGVDGPVIDFADSNAYFTLPTNIMTGATSGEIVARIKSATSSSQGGHWDFGSQTSLINHYPYAGDIYDDFGSTSRKSTGNTKLSVTQWRRYRVWSAPGDWVSYLDDTQQYATTSNTVGWAPTPRLGNGGSDWNGQMTVVIGYDHKLTATERADLDAWLLAHPSGGFTSHKTAATSSATGKLTVTRRLAGTATATSVSTGVLTPIRQLRGTATAESAAEGRLGITGIHYLYGTATAQATATGRLAIQRALVGTATATSSATGLLTKRPIPGDIPATAFVMAGTSGVQAINQRIMTVTTGEPPSEDGSLTKTAWMVHSPTAPGTITAQITAPSTTWDRSVIEAIDAELVSLDQHTRTGELAIAVSADEPIYLRIHPRSTSSSYATDVTVTWSFTERVPEVIFDVESPLDEAPGSVLISVANVEPDALFSIDLLDPSADNPILTGDTGPEGTIEESLPIPILLAGTYTLELTVGDVIVGTSLTITNDPLNSEPEPEEGQLVEPPVPPTPVPGKVIKWRLWDVTTDRIFEFPWNPSEWSGMHQQGATYYEHDGATVPHGQISTWQSAGRPYPWEFRGYLDTKAFHDELEWWADLRRRFWLTDHRNRMWNVTFASFDARRRLTPHKPWSHDYTIQAIYFSGPWHDDIPLE